MARTLIVALAALAITLGLARVPCAGAAEKTGEILSELLKAVEADFETYERETQGFAKRSTQLMALLEEKNRAFAAARDPMQAQLLQSEIYQAAAELNQQDRREISTTLRTIGDVRGNLEKIRGVLERGGLVPARHELPRFRQNIGQLMQSTVKLLKAWEAKATPEMRGEIDQIKGAVVSTLTTWESQGIRSGTSDDELVRTVRALDVTYSQLLSLQRVLEVEKQNLQARNYQAYIELVMTRLFNGTVNLGSFSDGVAAKQRGVSRRMELLNGVGRSLRPGGGNGLGGSIAPDAARVIERIDQGRFEWSREGGDR